MPDKIMKTLTIGNTKYTIQDTRVDSLENELDDKLDAPASAGSNGQILTLNSSGNPVWQNPPTELPSVSSSDNGKMLTVTNGAWAKGSVPTELPSVTTSDNGKILKVTSGAWAKGDVPTELPSVTTSDNNKILKVTNGAWAKGDVPTELPSVTSSDNDKMLTVTNGAWAKGDLPNNSVTYSKLDTNVRNQISQISYLSSMTYQMNYEHQDILNVINGITYVKGKLNPDGTIDSTANGCVSDIIDSPISFYADNSVAHIAVYKNGEIYYGKINPDSVIDTDSTTGWGEWAGGSYYFPDLFASCGFTTSDIAGVRLWIEPDAGTISNDAAAQAFADEYIEVVHSRRASYEYVDNKLNLLEQRIDRLENWSSPKQIQKICAAGLAPQFFDIGDIIYIEWVDRSPEEPVTYQYPFVVAHFGTVYDENDVAHNNAMYLMAMYTTPWPVPFDASEQIIATEEYFDSNYYYYLKSGSSYTKQTVTYGDPIPTDKTYYKHVLSNASQQIAYGYNNYKKSAIRQWLNSDAPKGTSWWTPQHDSDVAPTQASTVPGWLNGFSQEWLSIFKPIKIQTVTNTVTDGGITDVTYDKFFIPSIEQVYGYPIDQGVEGEYWEYWKNITGLENPSNGTQYNKNPGRKILGIKNNAIAGGMLRTVYDKTRYSNAVYAIISDYLGGYIGSYYCNSSLSLILPTCVIY